MEKNVEELQQLFHNNFVDILINPQWALKFPFSTFIENFSGYRRINHIITTDEESSDDVQQDTEDGQEISILNMIDTYVEGLPYSEQIKEKLKEVSVRFYQEASKELEEKRSYENT